MPLAEYSPGKLLEVLGMCPRGRGFGSQQRLPGAAPTAGPEPAASPGEQPGNGVSQVIWCGKNLPCLPEMLGPLSAPLS